jgi:alcohol dehydrogenase class IV
MTSIWGMTEAGVKTTGRDPKVQPRVALYDPELTLTLPPALSGASGVNALAHCVEALYARDTNPIVQLMAEEGIRALAESLPAVVERPADIEARSTALYGAWLAGACLGTAGVALHHKLCHTLGGTFNLPHAETHTIVLPYAVAYNRPAVPDAMNRMARAMRSDDPAGTLHRLVQLIGAPTALKELGMPEAGIGRAVDLALENPYWNPQPITRDGLKALLSDAFWGRPPGRYGGAAAVPKK